MSILTWVTFLPLLGAAVILCLPSRAHALIKQTALLFTLPPLVIGIWLFMHFDRTTAAFQFVQRAPWIESYNINYFVGVDGISISMVLLTVLLCPICILASWGIDKGVKGYFALFLLLDTGMMGVFVALDFFLFYIFWEVMLLPMYFLIGIWGGPRREYAAIKFFLYTLAGSVLMLIAMLVLYFSNEPHTFDITQLMAQSSTYGTTPIIWGLGLQHLLWLALFIGFAIKIPAFPFHTWLPDAHVEAPTAISVILAGVLLKMGTYGILRINFGVLPVATADLAFWFLAALGTWNIIYGALCAMAQTDLKKLVAYSSISHMGYVMLGMAAFTPQGINGAVLQMFNHGTVTAMLFLLVGVIYDRAHHRADRGLRRTRRDHARLHGRHRARVLRGDGPARSLGVHLRGARAARRVAEVPGPHHRRRQRGHPDRRLHALDDAAHLSRRPEREVPRPSRDQRARAGDARAARRHRRHPRGVPARRSSI